MPSAIVPVRRRRLPAFGASLLVHCAVVVVMILWPVSVPHTAGPAKRRYSVRLIQLQMPQEFRARADGGASRSGSAGATQSAGSHSAPSQAQQPTTAASETAEASLPEPPAAPEHHRQFELPPNARVQPVKQTLVQMDVPPDITLTQQIPVPTALLWQATASRKPFIAPPLKEIPKVAQRLQAPPTLAPPNAELTVARLDIASTILTNTPHLPQPPSIAPPVSTPGHEPAKEIPQIGVAGSKQPNAASLISLPPIPLHSSSVLVLPPANQIAPSDVGTNGSSPGQGASVGGKEHGSGGQEGSGSSASDGNGSRAGNGGTDGDRSGAPAGNASGEAGSGAGTNGHAGGGTPGPGNGGAGSGSSGNGAGGSNGGSGGSGSAGAGGSGGSGNGSTGTLAAALPGFTRLTLPKDGKFGVVVLGSAGADIYPESVGALSGKVVYTVYLKMGLRKSWILQYCLAKATNESAPEKGRATPVDPPWPFLMMRPDQWSASDPDYIMIHGMLTSAGQFDRLALVFPNELEERDLLLSSLKLWVFRPAARDGEPVAVEVLLIIPREAE